MNLTWPPWEKSIVEFGVIFLIIAVHFLCTKFFSNSLWKLIGIKHAGFSKWLSLGLLRAQELVYRCRTMQCLYLAPQLIIISTYVPLLCWVKISGNNCTTSYTCLSLILPRQPLSRQQLWGHVKSPSNWVLWAGSTVNRQPRRVVLCFWRH